MTKTLGAALPLDHITSIGECEVKLSDVKPIGTDSEAKRLTITSTIRAEKS